MKKENLNLIPVDEYREILKARINGNLGWDAMLNGGQKIGTGADVNQHSMQSGDVFSFRARFDKEKGTSSNPFLVMKVENDLYNISEGQTYMIKKDQLVVKVGHVSLKTKVDFGEKTYTLGQIAESAVVHDLAYNKKLLKETVKEVEKEKAEAK
jgi:hypothetical protein